MNEDSSNASGYFFALLAAFLWALIGPISRVCYDGGVEPMEVAFWRAVFGGMCFVGHALYNKEFFIEKKHALIFFLFGFWAVGFLFTSYQISVQQNGIGVAVILLYTAPAWVAVFSRAFFSEVLSIRKLAAIAVAMCGAAFISLSGSGATGAISMLGIGSGLLAGFIYATHFPFYVWWKNKHSSVSIYAYMLIGGSILLFPFTPISHDKSPQVWLALFAMGAITNYAAYFFYAKGLQRISPVRVAVISNFEPLTGIFLAWLFWNEIFSTAGWVGGALILTAVMLIGADKN